MRTLCTLVSRAVRCSFHQTAILLRHLGFAHRRFCLSTLRPTHLARGVLVVVVLLVAACSDDETTGPGGPSIASVTVIPGSAALSLGDTIQLTAEVRDGSGNMLTGHAVGWTSSDTAIVKVSSTGRVTARGTGSASITATVDDETGAAEISVESGPGNVVLCACAVIVDSTKIVLVSDSSELAAGTYRFQVRDPGGLIRRDSTVTRIVPGDIIVGAQGLGFLRNVESVSQVDDIITVETSQAPLPHLVIEGGLGGIVPLDDAPGESPSGRVVWRPTQTEYLVPGVAASAAGISLEGVSFSNVQVCKKTDEGGDVCFVFSVKVGDGGELTFTPNIDIGATMGAGSIEEFHARGSGVFRLHAPLSLGVAVTAGVSADKDVFELMDTVLVRKSKVVTYFVGPAPIVFLISAKFNVGLSAKAAVEATWETGIDLSYGVAGGVKYEGGAWQQDTPPVDPPGVDTQPLEFKGIKGKGELKFAAVVKIDVALYGVAGPFLDFGPYAAAAGEVSVIEPGGDPLSNWNAQLLFGFDVDLGMRTNEDIKKITGIGLEYKLLGFPLFPEVKAIEVFSKNDLQVQTITTAANGDASSLPDHAYAVSLQPAYDVKTPWWNIFDLDIGCETESFTLFGGVQTKCDPVVDDILPTATWTVEKLRSGNPHDLHIDKGKASNCKFGEDPRSEGPFVRSVSDEITVKPRVAGSPEVRTFEIECIPWGHLQVDISASGHPDDIPDEFLFYWFEKLDRANRIGVEPIFNRTAYQDSAGNNAIDSAFVAVTSPRTIDLIFDNVVVFEVPPNCAVQGAFFREVDVPSDATRQMSVAVHCEPLNVLTATSETVCLPDVTTCFLDENGYSLQISRGPLPGVSGTIVGWQGVTREAGPPPVFSPQFEASSQIGPDAVQAFRYLQTAEYEYVFSGVADACDIFALERRDELSSFDDGVYKDRVGVEAVGDSLHFLIECEGFAPTGLEAVPTNDSEVQLTWDAIDNPRAHVAGYGVYRDGVKIANVNGNAPVGAATDETRVTFVDKGVSPDSTYSYHVVMVRQGDGAEGEKSEPSTVTTLLAAPANLAATAVSMSQIDLAWDPVSGRESEVDFYNVYRNGAKIGSVEPSSEPLYSDTAGLSANSQYLYGVAAISDLGLEGATSYSDSVLTPPGVRDSALFALGPVIILNEQDSTQVALGTFEIPPHIAEAGVEVFVDVELSFDEQRDEAFAIGMLEPDGPVFIGDEACPVVADDPSLGRGWLRVGKLVIPAGQKEFVARHAVEFDCYQPNAAFETVNSIHYYTIKFVF